MEAMNKKKEMDQNREPSRASTSAQRRLSLRAKLTLGNLALTFVVILVMGLFVFFRIQESSRELVLRLEENFRTKFKK